MFCMQAFHNVLFFCCYMSHTDLTLLHFHLYNTLTHSTLLRLLGECSVKLILTILIECVSQLHVKPMSRSRVNASLITLYCHILIRGRPRKVSICYFIIKGEYTSHEDFNLRMPGDQIS